MPPAGYVGPPNEGEERSAFLLIGNAVETKQVRDVAIPEADPAELHAADVRVGRPDRVGGRCCGDTPRFTQPTQLSAQHNTQRGRPRRSPRTGPTTRILRPPSPGAPPGTNSTLRKCKPPGIKMPTR